MLLSTRNFVSYFPLTPPASYFFYFVLMEHQGYVMEYPMVLSLDEDSVDSICSSPRGGEVVIVRGGGGSLVDVQRWYF